jgi:hypothetical protein
LSSAVIACLLKAKRESTNRLYQSRWHAFSTWCAKKKLDLKTVGVPHIADLLVTKFHEKAAQNTVKGYLTYPEHT